MLQQGCALTRKNTTHHEDADLGAQSARRNAFFDAGDTQPARSGANSSRCAKGQRVAIGIGFHNGQNIGMRWIEYLSESKRVEESIVVFEGMG